MMILNSWVSLALLGAIAASLGTIFAKIGLQDIPSHIVTTIRGIVMAIVVTFFTLANDDLTYGHWHQFHAPEHFLNVGSW